MGKSRRANSVLFGFDFQVNAAIVLMLENMKEMDSLRLDSSIVLSKKAIVWPLIVLATDVQKSISKIIEVLELDDGQVNDVVRKYKDLIDYSCEKYEFTTKVLSDFIDFRRINHETTVCRDFANNYCAQYRCVLNLEDNEENNIVTKIILYLIVVNRYDVDRIKKEANL